MSGVSPHLAQRRPWFFAAGGLLVICVLGLATLGNSADGTAPAEQQPAATVRTTTVRKGSVVRTIRLSGTTAAERYSSLLVPRMRFSRSDRLREGTTFTGPGATFSVASTARAGSSSSSAFTGSGQVASTIDSSSSAGRSSAFTSSTSRVGRAGSSAPRTGNVSNAGAGANGGALGSTSSQLLGGNLGGGGGGGGNGGGGGGGGRGGGDSALVLETAARAGSVVKAGTPVAEFDRQFIMNRLEDYRASVAQMRSSFEKLIAEIEAQRKAHDLTIENAKAALEQAKLDLKLLPVLGTMDSERTRLAAEEAEARYKQLQAEQKFVTAKYASQRRDAELELKQAELELARATAMADQMILKAPINGLVVMQTTFRGGEMAQIQAGDQLWPGMMFMQIVDPSSMVINASLNQVDAEYVRVGSRTTVRFDAFPGLELPARVHAIGAMTRPGGMRASFVKEIPVVLKLEGMDPRVIPDLSVSCDVEIASEAEAVVASEAAVFRDAYANEAFVFVKTASGWQRRTVSLGLSNNIEVAVRSGAQAGDVLALEMPPGSQSPGGPPATGKSATS